MITPNLLFKLVAIFFFLLGILNLIYQKNMNKIVGVFMIYYAYVNILSLRNKGKKKFKLALLKINICLLSFIFLITLLKILNDKNTKNKNINSNDILLIICVILVIMVIGHYISIKNYKL